MIAPEFNINYHLSKFVFDENIDFFSSGKDTKSSELITSTGAKVPIFTNEFWTARQRQADSIHEISYRACFKPQLPRFFIMLLSCENDWVYDPFSGRGTTIIEAALLKRNVISNDINPLSEILCRPRLFPPSLKDVSDRLQEIQILPDLQADIDLSMFFHPDTLKEILSIRKYLYDKKCAGNEDILDLWIRMVATNRLTGHSRGFFSVYTLPPNQAVSAGNQVKINIKRNQKPEYKDTKSITVNKTKDLIKDLNKRKIDNLKAVGGKAVFLGKEAGNTEDILDNSVQLTVTSPPFLNIVQYAEDNWLRCWFNCVDCEDIGQKITMSKTIESWTSIMQAVFRQLQRITKPGGYIAFEVGEIRNGEVKLDHHVTEIGLSVGLHCECIMINEQSFTKTANIWGVTNNQKGTNTNRIVIFKKQGS